MLRFLSGVTYTDFEKMNSSEKYEWVGAEINEDRSMLKLRISLQTTFLFETEKEQPFYHARRIERSIDTLLSCEGYADTLEMLRSEQRSGGLSSVPFTIEEISFNHLYDMWMKESLSGDKLLTEQANIIHFFTTLGIFLESLFFILRKDLPDEILRKPNSNKLKFFQKLVEHHATYSRDDGALFIPNPDIFYQKLISQ